MRVTLPAELKYLLKEPVELLAKRARSIYDQKENSGGRTATSTNGAGRSGYFSAGSTKANSGRAKPYAEALESAAEIAGERPALRRIVKSLKSESPEVARELGW